MGKKVFYFNKSVFVFFSLLAQALNYWIKKYGWKDQGDLIYISTQDANIKTKNITEKIEFENLSTVMSKCI